MSVLIDPDDYDCSEQQFEASLNQSSPARDQECEPSWELVGAVAPAQQEETNRVDETPYWRSEVTSRVESYRAKRKRPPRERSLSLDFDRAMNRAITSESSVASRQSPIAEESQVAPSLALGTSSRQSPVEDDSSPTPEVEGRSNQFSDPQDAPEQASPASSEETGDRRLATGDCSNIIEFPRPPLVVMPPSAEELAEPVIDKPRILDAPEAVETAQAPLAGIELEPEEEAPAVEFELPLVVATLSQRVFAGLMDLLVVMLANAVFLMIVLRAQAELPPGKIGMLLLVAAPVLFWAVYEYLFLVHAGSTPGMRIARLELLTFEGEAAGRRVRRGRALAMVLSCLSLGLGLLWALLDEDTLCWHDRISRTYMVSSW